MVKRLLLSLLLVFVTAPALVGTAHCAAPSFAETQGRIEGHCHHQADHHQADHDMTCHGAPAKPAPMHGAVHSDCIGCAMPALYAAGRPDRGALASQTYLFPDDSQIGSLRLIPDTPPPRV